MLCESFGPDIVVADTEMADEDGTAFGATVTGELDCYVIGIDTTGSERARIAWLQSGADDVMSLPVNADELAARCEALIRRRPQPLNDEAPVPHRVIELGPLAIDRERHELRFDGRHIAATRIEFSLLEHLVQRRTEVVPRRKLLDAVWGAKWVGDAHVVDVHLSNLRHKLADILPDVPVIHTVRGIGFRISSELLDAATPAAASLHLAAAPDHGSSTNDSRGHRGRRP